jgi:hypothetical protein
MRWTLVLLAASLLHAQQQGSTPAQDPEKARLEGRVFNSVTGEPLRKTRLTLRMNVAQRQGQGRQQQEQPVTTYTVTSDAEGKYAFANVEPGDYELIVVHDGFADLRLGDRSARKPEPILLGAKDTKSDFNLKLVPYGSISGILVDEDGDPVRNMPVAAMTWRYTNSGRESQAVKSATTNDLGEYRIYDVPSGKYFLKIDPPRLFTGGPRPDSFMPVFYPGVLEISGALPQEVAPGQQLRGLNFNLRRVRFATIRGQVIAPAGSEKNAGLLIVTDGGDGTTSTGGGIGTDGKFSFTSVPPGPIYVTGGYTIDGQRYDTMVGVDVGTADISGLEIRPVPPMDVTGTIRIAGRTAIKPSQMTLNLRGPSAGRHQEERAIIRDDGSLLFHGVSAGKYRVDIGQRQNLYIKSVQWGTQDVTDSGLDLLAGIPPRTELTITLAADGGQIEGIATNDKSEPADGATVTLVPTGGHRSRPFHKSSTVDSAGHFTIRGIAPGEYKLYAWDKVDTNAVIYDPDFLRPYDALGTAIEVAASDNKVIELKVIANKEQ